MKGLRIDPVCVLFIRDITPSTSISVNGWSPFLLKNSARVSFGLRFVNVVDMFERFDMFKVDKLVAALIADVLSDIFGLTIVEFPCGAEF